MSVTWYTTVSDLSLCQRCPALFAYKILMKEKDAWRVGIEGNGYYYGSIFHEEIAEKFFSAASNPNNKFHKKILASCLQGAESLKEFIRGNIFIPFIEKKSESLTSGQILSIAHAIEVWVEGMSIFFDKKLPPVFLPPEGKLQGCYEIQDAKLIINGRYDALIFNQKKAEARIFEFKGFKKSDITVPLSQSLIYSWLIEKTSGIIPSIEIIYLDEEKPEIFSSEAVKDMISKLPNLFYSALNILLLRRMPEMLHDKNLCEVCKFQNTCRNDMNKIFKLKKHRGASMLSLLIFLFASVVITAQVFFFSNISASAVKEDRQILGIRLQLAKISEEVKNNYIKTGKIRTYSNKPQDTSGGTITFDTDIKASYASYKDLGNKKGSNSETDYKNFYEGASGTLPKTLINEINNANISMDVFTLDYTYITPKVEFNNATKIVYEKNNGTYLQVKNNHKKIFAPMGSGYYLIRARKEFTDIGKVLMLQTLVSKDVSRGTVTTQSCEEIWY